MKVLLDTCVATSAKAVLRKAGHEVDHVGNWPEDPGDATVLAYAADHGSLQHALPLRPAW